METGALWWDLPEMLDDESPLYEVAMAEDRESWLVAMDKAAEASGFFERLGARHWAHFADEATTLVVGFETVAQARARPGQLSLAQAVAERQGWSSLTVLSEGPGYWRDPAVWGFFDRLVDEAFFEDFDRVLFYGAGAGGYAAAAYAVAAPGAQVFLCAPRASLAPAVAGWDHRDRAARRLDFTSRYGYAPDMIEGAGQVFVVFDPRETMDAMHAALFRGPHVQTMPLPRAGADIEGCLQRLGVLEDLLIAAARGRLTRTDLARAWRKRRADAPYLKATLAQLAQGKSRRREMQLCRAVSGRMNLPRLRRRLAELESLLG